MGVVGANVAEARGSLYGVTKTGDEVECKKSEVRFLAEDNGRKSALRSGETTAPDLLGQEAGDSGGMGGLMAYNQDMRKEYW